MSKVLRHAKSIQFVRWILVLPAAFATIYLLDYSILPLTRGGSIDSHGFVSFFNAFEIFTPLVAAVFVAPSRRYLAPLLIFAAIVLAGKLLSQYQSTLWQLGMFILHDMWVGLIASTTLGIVLDVRGRRKSAQCSLQANPARS